MLVLRNSFSFSSFCITVLFPLHLIYAILVVVKSLPVYYSVVHFCPTVFQWYYSQVFWISRERVRRPELFSLLGTYLMCFTTRAGYVLLAPLCVQICFILFHLL
jgi:hypothetical protein